MTKEEINVLGFEDLEKRSAEIAEETKEADAEKLEELNKELDSIESRKKVLTIEVEETRKKAEEVANGHGEVIEERKDNTMTNEEVRNSSEYIDAYAKYVKTGNDKECRTLLSTNATNGVVPVPDFVAGIVAKALEGSEILRRVRRMEAAGNVKVGFEYGAPAAVAHKEGGDPISEENLLLGVVTLVPQTWKKYVQISDEALDSMNGPAYLQYIYEEVTRGIIQAREDAVVEAILAAPAVATATEPAVPEGTATTPALADFVNARALLSSAARDLVIICTPTDYAAYRALQLGASYAADPFDGLTVLFNDKATTPIIGDLSGVMENCPKGESVQFKYDDTTLMASDVVKVLGRMPSAIAVVGNKFLAKIATPESE